MSETSKKQNFLQGAALLAIATAIVKLIGALYKLPLNMAIGGLFSRGDHVITTDLEHNSVLRPLYRLEDEGVITLSVVPADRQGRVEYADFERLLRPETRGIVCTHASNLTGNVLDLERIGGIARTNGLLFVVDASQTAGAYPIDMERMQIDALCAPGHKGLLGPQGVGFFLLRSGLVADTLTEGGSGYHSLDGNVFFVYN